MKLPVFDVDVGPLGAVGVDDVAALDEEAVLRALHVRHLLQRGGVGRRHGSLQDHKMLYSMSKSDSDIVSFRCLYRRKENIQPVLRSYALRSSSSLA